MDRVQYSTNTVLQSVEGEWSFISYLFFNKSGEGREITRMAVTTNLEQVVGDEITRAIEEHAENVTRSNAGQIFKYKFLKSGTTWGVQCCTVCRKPTFAHQDPWDANCTAEPISQITIGEYIDQLENHKKIQQIADRMKPDKKTKFKHREFSEEDLKKEEYRVDKKTKY